MVEDYVESPCNQKNASNSSAANIKKNPFKRRQKADFFNASEHNRYGSFTCNMQLPREDLPE
jgi:hypothetical protein